VEKQKNCKVKIAYARSIGNIGKQSGVYAVLVLKKKRKAAVERISRKGKL